MPDEHSKVDRRTFLQAAGGLSAAAFGLAATALQADEAEPTRDGRQQPLALGLDNFAVRAMGWKAPTLVEYAAKLKVDSLFISDLDAFESLDDAYLKKIRALADDQDLALHVGTWSICPTSTTFRDKWGTAEEHLATGIRVAQILGSPVLRVILGNQEDRKTPGGIDARIDDTVKVCRAARNRAMDAGVKIAVENHAGDLQARELVRLIEEAGKEYVGENMDSGNAVWALDDPLTNLELLGPYALTTSLRDSGIWESKLGVTVQWTAMGDGAVDWKRYFERFAELCSNTPVHIETISGFNREIPLFEDAFWKTFPDARGESVARLLAMAKRGKAREAKSFPDGDARQAAEQAYQKNDLERSLAYCRSLGLGRKKE